MSAFGYTVCFVVGVLMILYCDDSALRALGAWFMGMACYHSGEYDGIRIGRRDALNSGRKLR